MKCFGVVWKELTTENMKRIGAKLFNPVRTRHQHYLDGEIKILRNEVIESKNI